ncbi:hypothetical protein [Rhabdothermincola sp.]|jgi:hypothetical protein|uniref:hypothetical protein n=1 Tax=Rhabdothermincola sp. TaxID=2820405 RepID=UPI002FE29BF6
MIPDGTYDVFVVDATPEPGEPGGPPVWHLELTILAGEHRSEVVAVRAAGLRGSEFDLIGIPGTLTVEGGEPRFRLDG